MLALILHLKYLDNKTIWKLCLSSCFSIFFVLKFGLFPNDYNKCVECFGNELCPFFENGEIQLTWFSLFLYIINPKLSKSVFYGIFNNTEIVVKKIIRTTEKRDESNAGLIDEIDNFIVCDSVDVGFLLDEIKNVTKKSWLDLRSSSEPLLLMYFQTQGKWPFPSYYGACGDFIVEEYKGEPLANFLFSNFMKRIFLAASLLEMAELFTFGHPSLAFYFTDYSLDNLVVDSSGNVSLIDLDNVIISNKSAVQGNNSLKRSIHSSEILDDYEYAFSSDDICMHHLSDHNYFSVCKYLLSHPGDGLLNNIPLKTEKWKKALWLLDECSKPDIMSDRFSAGQDLRSLLREITNDFVWS